MDDKLRNILNNQTKTSDSGKLKLIWLGIRDGNIAFEDSLDFDISEIESIYEHQEDNENYSVETL